MNATAFNLNFSGDKPDIRSVIPAGTPLFLEHTYTPGGVGPDGALTESKNTDAVYLKSEFTVLRGPYKGRKFWGNLTLAGGKLDEKGQSIAGGISRKTIRLMIDSACGLKSTDDSPEANAKRDITKFGLKALQKIRFVAKAKIEPESGGYPEKNGLGQVLTIDMKGYPSEAELDKPTVAGDAVKPPAPAPAWNNGGDGSAKSPTITEQTSQQATAAPAGVLQQAQTADASNVPAWAR